MPGGSKPGGGLTVTPYKMKGSPMQRNFGISPAKAVTKEVVVKGGKGGESRAQRDYKKTLDKKASDAYMRDRASRTGGTDFNTADPKTKAKYRAKAQSSPAKAAPLKGTTPGHFTMPEVIQMKKPGLPSPATKKTGKRKLKKLDKKVEKRNLKESKERLSKLSTEELMMKRARNRYLKN